MAHPSRPSSADDAAQRQVLQSRIAILCMSLTSVVCAIDLSVWRATGDIWKLSIALCMAVLTAFFGASLVLQRRGRHAASLWAMLASIPIALTWVMVTGGAATTLPTLVAMLAMMSMLPDTLYPDAISPRRWMGVLLAAYVVGIVLRLMIRGLDFAGSPAELAILVLVPVTLIFAQWMLIQRIFRDMRATLGESEMLRRDLEERNRDLVTSQRALERASAAKSQFLANMSHELRTPLNIILGYTEIIEDELAEEPDRDRTWNEDLSKIRTAGAHLLSLISDVLDLAKIEAGKTTLHSEPFSLLVLAHEAADACQPLVQRRRNRLHLELDPRTDEVSTDRTKLRQILLNLLSNAAKFTEDGEITLRTRVDAQDRIIIEVQDTGLGVTEEAQGRIFDAFEQADTSSTRSHGGTGLGLTLIRQFATLLGGAVTLESRPGQGSLFRVSIPREPPVEGLADHG